MSEPGQARTDPTTHAAREQNRICEEMAEKVGDELTLNGHTAEAGVAYRIAALIRIHRDKFLEPF